MDKSMIGIENTLIMLAEKALSLKTKYINIAKSKFEDEIVHLDDIIDFTTALIQKIK